MGASEPGCRASASSSRRHESPEHVRRAEELGFASAWVYDSPLLYQDAFATLALAAERTSRIELGVGVIVPGLRAPVATASALRTGESLAPGRVRVAVGAGFTGPFTLGLGPVRIAKLRREVEDLRALLSGGQAVHADGGGLVELMPVTGAGGTSARIPVLVSCRGPRAQAVARELGDGAVTGIFYPGRLSLLRRGIGDDLPLVVHAVGAVAEPGEPLDSPRLAAAVGPVVAVAFHAFAEQPWRLEGVEPAVRAQVESYIAAVRGRLSGERFHLELHRGHLVELCLPEDPPPVTSDNVRRFSFTGTARELRARAEALAADGVDELSVQVNGDVPSELERLASALL